MPNVFIAFSYQLSSWSTYQGTSSRGYESFTDQVKYNQFFELENVNVKFTQNDTNYIFKISAKAKDSDVQGKISGGIAPGYIYYTVHPFLYKTKDFGNSLVINESVKMGYADYVGGDTYYRASLYIGETCISKVDRTYDSSGTVKTDTSTGNGDKFFAPNSARCDEITTHSSYYKYVTTYPHVKNFDNGGVAVLNNSSICTFNSQTINSKMLMTTIDFNINMTLSINKNYIDHYQHVCFGTSYAVETARSAGTTNWGVSGYSLCTNTINLKDYVDCEHNWTYIDTDDTMNHIVKCSKCEWEKKENHDCKYEYDGLTDNTCICRYNKKVNQIYVLNDDNNGTITETIDSNVSYASFSNLQKKGYKFTNFKKYVKDVVGTLSEIKTTLEEVYKGEVSVMDTVSGRLSTKYVAEYEPIKYNIVFHSENNLNLDIGFDKKEIRNAVYDMAYDVPKINIKGYAIKGFTTTKGSDNIEYPVNEKLKNLTYVEGETINLYPVIDKLRYSIDCEYYQKVATKSIVLDVTYGTKCDLPEVKILPLTAKKYGWYYGDVKVDNSLDVDKYVLYDNQSITLYFKMDDGASAYIDDVTNFTYQIKYLFPSYDRSISSNKDYISKFIKVSIGANTSLYNEDRLTISSGNTGNGWYYKEKKVNNTSELDAYVRYNEEILEVTYRYFKNQSVPAPEHDSGKSSETNNVGPGGQGTNQNVTPTSNGSITNQNITPTSNGSITNQNITPTSQSGEVDISYQLYPIKDETTSSENIEVDKIESEKKESDKEQDEKVKSSDIDEDGEDGENEDGENDDSEDDDSEDDDGENDDSSEIDDKFLFGPKYIDDVEILKYMKGINGPFLYEMYKKEVQVDKPEDILRTNKYNLLSASIADFIDFLNNNKIVAFLGITFLLILLIIYEYFTIKYYNSGKGE